MILKVALYNSEGKITSLMVFHGSQPKPKVDEIFSKEKVFFINEHSISIQYIPIFLLMDDSITTIKYKILYALKEKKNICLEELYLFGHIERNRYEINNDIRQITENQTDSITEQKWKQYSMNHFGILEEQDDVLLETTQQLQNSLTIDTLRTSTWYSYSKKKEKIPLGIRMEKGKSIEYFDSMFPANPFDMLLETTIQDILNSKKIQSVEEDFLFHYHDSFYENTLFLCFATDVNTFMREKEKPFYFLTYYFPRLSSVPWKGSTLLEIYEKETNIENTNSNSNSNTRALFAEKNDKKIKELLPYWNRMDTFLSLGNGQILSYQYQGIDHFQFTIYDVHEYSDSIRFPLDAIFKNIHATKNIPLIEYSPGKNLENMLRIYYEETAINGNKIPFYSETMIQKWFNEKVILSKGVHEYISFVVVQNEADTLKIVLEGTGNIKIYGRLAVPKNLKELEKYIKTFYDSSLEEVNEYLALSGYSVCKFESFLDRLHVRVDYMNYMCQLISTTKYNEEALQNTWNILLQKDVKKRQEESTSLQFMRYIRVENYQPMNEMDQQITDLCTLYKDNILIIKKLLKEIYPTKSDAEIENDLSVYGEKYKTVRGRNRFITRETLASSGFLVHFLKPSPQKNYCQINVHGITQIDYLYHISSYLDTLMLIFINKAKPLENIVLKRIEVLPLPIQDTREKEEFVDVGKEDEEDDEEEDDFNKRYFMNSESEKSEPSEPSKNSEQSGGAKEYIPTKESSVVNILKEKLKGVNPELYESLRTAKPPLYTACQTQLPISHTEKELNELRKLSQLPKHILEYKYENSPTVFYTCPNYWCTKQGEERFLTKEEAESGVCGKIIKDPKYIKEGEYVIHNESNLSPNFVNNSTNPNTCYPCCAAKWSNKPQTLKRAQCNPNKYPLVANGKEISQKDKRSIFKENMRIKHVLKYNDILKNTALEHGRIGLVPDLILKFMEVKEDWFRIGVEDSTNQSFLACLSDVYSWKQEKGLQFYLLSEFRTILCEKITLDVFLQLQNGSLVSVFTKKKMEFINVEPFRNSRFLQNIETMSSTWSNDHKQNFIQHTLQSYHTFLQYLKDETVLIDPTYLWEAVSKPNVLFEKGMNIVIMEMVKTEKNNIHIVCPAYPFEPVFDLKKDTLFLCKEEGNYEPIIKYKKQEDPNTKQIKVSITKLFPYIDELKNVFGKLNKMNQLTSLPASRFLNAEKTFEMLQPKYTIYKKIYNDKQKIVGFLVAFASQLQVAEKYYIPCFPSYGTSALLLTLSFQWQDTLEGTDFKDTVDFLRKVYEDTKINCIPEYIVIENKMIIGLLTKMNLFIRIANTPDIHFDESYTFLKKKSTDFIRLDTYLTQNIQKPKMSVYPLEVKKIHLENQFYNTFRTLVRIQMRHLKNKTHVRKMLDILESSFSISQKRNKIESMIRDLIKNKVAFQIYDDKVLSEYISMASFSKPSMIYTNTGVLLLPVSNLVTGMDNNIIYYGRLSDEMVRNRQVQPFMFFPDKYLNISQTEYSIFHNEFLILKPVLSKDYFEKLKRFPFGEYARETTFDTWNP